MNDADLDRHIRAIIGREGGWVDDPDDSGGPTNYGITLETLRAYFKDMGFPGVPTKASLRSLSPSTAHGIYRWYFRTQGLADLIDEFSIPDELVPLVMDMRTLHSLEGCRKILRGALGRMDELCFSREMLGYTDAVEVITLSRMRYMLQVAERSPKDRKFVRGWMHRALKAIGMWPPEPETEVKEA